MNRTSGAERFRRAVAELRLTAWPTLLPEDSEWQRRKKLAVRGGQSALAILVAAAVLGTTAFTWKLASAWQIMAMLLAGLTYFGWCLRGTREAVRLLLWEEGAPPAANAPGRFTWPVAGYFLVQLSLAALIYALGDRGRATPVLWLVLLPPVAHAVILLPWGGVVAVSLTSVGILLVNVLRGENWLLAPMGLLLFVFALLFTVVFTSLAVGSERARSEVLRLASELQQANHRLRAYAVQADELAASRERNRLAREIHDSLGHSLTVVNVQLEAARALRDTDAAAAWGAVEKAQKLTLAGLGEIRRSVASLRASPLDDRPLPQALAVLAEEGRAEGTFVEVEVLGTPRPLPPAAALTLFRAGQEGLTNARKHAQARRVRLTLDYTVPQAARVAVVDDGRGADGVEQGFGLLGLRERAQLLGGRVRVETAPGKGFTLEVEVPG